MDWQSIRKQTPSCESLIHFNNAGAALSPTPVVRAVEEFLKAEQKMGGYEAEEEYASSIECFYTRVAKLIGACPEEIAFSENATRAWDMAFYSIPFKKGDRILTGHSEYGSNYLAMLQMAQRVGVEIHVIPNDTSGQIDLDLLSKALDDRVKLVALTHIPTSQGGISPATQVGALVKKFPAYFLLDACQSLGQLNIDVEALGCDMMCGTGRKYLRGPRGTGFLYVRQSVLKQLNPPFVDIRAGTWVGREKYVLREDAKRFESWECHIAGKLGLSEAISYALEIGLDNIESRIRNLGGELRGALGKIPGVDILDQGDDLGGIVSFKTDVDPQILTKSLRKHQINTSVIHLQTSPLDLEPRNIVTANRASVHYYNTEGENIRFLETLKNLRSL